MLGSNLFERGGRKYFSGTNPCIFISHSKKDKTEAGLVAKALMAMSVDVYFDENDKVLQQASYLGADEAIVKCIEDGLDNSTHLLGIITPNTKDSWWVPYEIGGATGRKKDCAHLIAKNVSELPSYIKIHKVLPDQDDLLKWVAGLIGNTKSVLTESMNKHMASQSLNFVLPEYRSSGKLSFYQKG